MGVSLSKYAAYGNEGTAGFNWDMYSDGWNGTGLKTNKSIHSVKGHKDKVFSHEDYALSLYKKINKIKVEDSKELKKNVLVSINDFKVINSDQILATINNGANNIIIDLNKEQKFFNTIEFGDKKCDKNDAIKYLSDDKYKFLAGNNAETGEPVYMTFKQLLLSMDLKAKIGTDEEKASIWDGYVEKLTQDMIEQVNLKNKATKAYNATILSTNRGGFVVEIANTIKAFMPGSMAGPNKIEDYEALVGKTYEVMVESYDKNYGFVVSRKKYLRTVTPIEIAKMVETLKTNQDTIFTGHITGANQYGVYVEINEFITGMIHKTLASDTLREAMRNNTIVPGTEINVYVSDIVNGRVILSDVPSTERDAVIARREEEDAKEKAFKKAETLKAAKAEAKAEVKEEANKE